MREKEQSKTACWLPSTTTTTCTVHCALCTMHLKLFAAGSLLMLFVCCVCVLCESEFGV